MSKQKIEPISNERLHTIYVNDIKWDTTDDDGNEYEDVKTANLPKTVEIDVDEEFYNMIKKNPNNYYDEISDYLSDDYEFCVKGFSVSVEPAA